MRYGIAKSGSEAGTTTGNTSSSAADAQVLDAIAALCAADRPEHFTDHTHCCECAEHDDLLLARELDTLTIDDVGNPGWDPVCFVTDGAFFYLFPALARLALDPLSDAHGWYLDQLLFYLTYEGAANRRRRAANAQQIEAVGRLLEHVRDTRADSLRAYSSEDDLRRALEIWRP